MKKRYYAGIAVTLLALIVPTLVFAAQLDTGIEKQNKYLFSSIERVSADVMTSNGSEPCSTDRQLSIIGKWGKDKVTEGYFAATISRKDRVAVLRGVYNHTGEQERTKFIGIMKKGYFNGRIITDEGGCKITGLYRVDTEQKVLRMQWMVPGSAGWAMARLKLNES